MALTLLGAGFEPFIEKYLLDLNPLILYWINMISAVLDNATLAAAEISPEMNDSTIKALLLGLLISGGMLIPGNIPNIIAAGKLNIKSIEWARFGVPIGLIAMVIYFVVIHYMSVKMKKVNKNRQDSILNFTPSVHLYCYLISSWLLFQ